MAGETMMIMNRCHTRFAHWLVLLLLAWPTATFAQDAEVAEAKSDAATPSSEQGEAEEKPAAEKKETPEEPAPVPFNLQPYKVTVEVAFSRRCLPDPAVRSEVLADIDAGVARMFGQMFDYQSGRASWLAPGTAYRLNRLSVEKLLERFPEEQVQKAFLICIEDFGSGFRINVREFDSRVQEVTPIFSQNTFVVSSLGQITAELIRDAFRPVALFKRKFDGPDQRELMEMIVQAGEFPSPDPSAEQIVEGDVLRPFLRQMDRRNPNKLNILRAMPLSYIRVQSIGDPVMETEPGEFADAVEGVPDEPYADVDGRYREVGRSSITGLMLSHLPATLFGSRSRSVQHIGIRQRPSATESRVRLVLRGRNDKPLISHRIALAFQLHWKDPEDTDFPQVQLVSDRNGEVVIQQNPKHPTFWIRVYSGSSLLARVPYAPGLIPYDTVELPDDSIRLGVEGELKLLEDELIDAIALRGVLMARARNAADAGKTEDVKKFLEQYAIVNAKEYFLDQVTNVQVPAANAIKAMRRSTTRVDKLCQRLKDSVGEFFSDEKRAERQKEIESLRRKVNLPLDG